MPGYFGTSNVNPPATSGLVTFSSLSAAIRAGFCVDGPTEGGYVVSQATTAGRVRALVIVRSGAAA